jgi:hypothetical protein
MNNAAEKKGADRLDTRSTDALHWAECFCEQIGADKDMVDDLMPWFANYWAAVNDPLQNKIDLLRNELEIAHGKSLAVSESFAHLESTTCPRDLVDQLIDAVKDTLETPNPEAPDLVPEYDAYVSGLIAQLQGVKE